MNPALARFIAQFKPLSEVLLDSWFIVDHERNLVDFNHAFRALLPRPVARGLEGKKCHAALQLEICGDRCIGEQCWREARHVRLNEIGGHAAQSDNRLRFVVSAVPVFDDEGSPVGLLEIQRNVTDEAAVQAKYQEILDHEARERELLAAQIRERTRELLETNKRVLELRTELLKYKRGLLV